MMQLFGSENKTFIDHLLIDTDGMKKPVSYKEVFNEAEISVELVKKTIIHAIKYHARENFKVWRNGNECGDSVSKILCSELSIDSDIEEWFKEIFLKEKSCMFIGNAEQFDDGLLKVLSHFMKPFLSKYGVTFGGCTITLILGNYGYTPVGIHNDSTENTIFHFNLGPGLKEIYTWNLEQYNDLLDENGLYKNIDCVIPISKKFVLDKGSFFCMPAKEYHIAKTADFSIDIVVVLSDRTNVKYTNEIMTSFLNACCPSTENIVEMERFDLSSSVEDIISKGMKNICIEDDLKYLSLQDLVKNQIERSYFSLLSNEFWLVPPYVKGEEFNFGKSWKRIHINEPFKIYSRALNEGKWAVYLRGRELIVKNHPGFVSLIDILNSSESIASSDLDKLSDQCQLSINSINKFIDLTIEYKAVEVLE